MKAWSTLQELEVIRLSKLYQGEYRVTSWFGPRNLDGDTRPHKGIDCVGLTSKNVIAPTNGKVVSSQIITVKNDPVWGNTWEWGNYVKMDDLNGYYLHFCHLSKRLVFAGQAVSKGQIIGIEGQTGYSKGSHLHFEVRRKSDNVSINPMDYFEILEAWELKHYRQKAQSRFDFDNDTMRFFDGHPYPGSLFEKLATKK